MRAMSRETGWQLEGCETRARERRPQERALGEEDVVAGAETCKNRRFGARRFVACGGGPWARWGVVTAWVMMVRPNWCSRSPGALQGEARRSALAPGEGACALSDSRVGCTCAWWQRRQLWQDGVGTCAVLVAPAEARQCPEGRRRPPPPPLLQRAAAPPPPPARLRPQQQARPLVPPLRPQLREPGQAGHRASPRGFQS
mmetsp:Transcript_14852/g.39983  ORF Transcript_14852/g.39983 Transcript_14852/m.39983 type:complete len:200 (-) Transcript_14852:887-1486(-)